MQNSLRKPVEPPSAAPAATEDRLLAAAEAMIAEQGLLSLRTRSLAARAQLNMGMIRYCFGGIEPLVCELLRRNLARFIAVQSQLAEGLGADASLEEILHALLAPVQTPAVYTPGTRAAAVLQDIFAHASPTVKEEANSRMHLSFAPLVDRLVAACPRLSRDTVLWRFCCVCAGSLSLSPRAPAWHLFQSLAGHDPVMGDQELAELIATAAGALRSPPAIMPKRR